MNQSMYFIYVFRDLTWKCIDGLSGWRDGACRSGEALRSPSRLSHELAPTCSCKASGHSHSSCDWSLLPCITSAVERLLQVRNTPRSPSFPEPSTASSWCSTCSHIGLLACSSCKRGGGHVSGAQAATQSVFSPATKRLLCSHAGAWLTGHMCTQKHADLIESLVMGFLGSCGGLGRACFPL